MFKVGLPRACLFWKEMVLKAYDGINLVLSNSSSSTSTSSLSDSPCSSLPTAPGNDRPLPFWAVATSNESNVAQTCHLAARHVTACALWVILAALRSRMNIPVTKVTEHSCNKTDDNCHISFWCYILRKSEYVPWSIDQFLVTPLLDRWSVPWSIKCDRK